MKAYHFLKDDMTAGSGNEPAWTIGEERTFEGNITICESGYHSSPSWYDCLNYIPGNMACIVEISKPIKSDQSKQVSRTRKLVDARNAEKVLRTFACDCAERALKKENITAERSWNAIKTARLYNEGKANKEDLASAWAAARASAWDAAWAVARDADWAVARDAARDAEISWQKRHLNKLMKELFKE